MASAQIDLPGLAKAIAEAYEQSVNIHLDQTTRTRFQVAADQLSERFDLVSGRWFEDTAQAFVDANDSVEATLDALAEPLESAAKVAETLGFLKGLVTAIDGVLGLLL